jgi:hypothetical protein|tara:strand:+ start:232 stop:486 length:255 start_codon:yes stop_codon:yes gene_type:complete
MIPEEINPYEKKRTFQNFISILTAEQCIICLLEPASHIHIPVVGRRDATIGWRWELSTLCDDVSLQAERKPRKCDHDICRGQGG